MDCRGNESSSASDEFTQAVADKLVEMYKIDTSKADVIIGYRADDNYMNVVKSFAKSVVC